MYRVVVPPTVSAAIGRLCPDRAGMIRVLTDLRDALAGDVTAHRKNRDPGDPDLFLLSVAVTLGDKPYTLVFAVNDARAPDHLFVESVTRTP